MLMSRTLNRMMAKQAIDLVLPSILAAIESRKLGDYYGFHIVIVNPLCQWSEHTDIEWSILYEYSHGNPEHWKYEFQKIARSKAMISWRTGLSTRVVQLTAPHLLIEGDTIYYGSVVIDGIVVAVSGFKQDIDELFAGMIALACKGLSSYETKIDETIASNEGWITKDPFGSECWPVDLTGYEYTEELAALVPLEMILKHRILPIGMKPAPCGQVLMVTSDKPLDPKVAAEIGTTIRSGICSGYSDSDQLDRAIDQITESTEYDPDKHLAE